MGHIWLADSLKLTVLAIDNAPGKRNAYTARVLRRLPEEDENLTIDEAVLAAAALAALGGRSHEQAVATLSAMADRASPRPGAGTQHQVGNLGRAELRSGT
jgi:hypothetical protein